MDPPADNSANSVILLTGGTGYVGGRLIPLLEQQPVKVRCLARSPDKLRSRVQPGTDLSFDLVKALTDRLPVMLCPRWLTTPTQPIAVDDVLAYLLAAKDLPLSESRIFEIGSPDVTTYGGMIREYARQRGLRRWLISVPVLTPYLSSLWLALVTPTAFEVGRHLIEGLKNPTVVRDTKALDVFPIRPMGIPQAIQKALSTTA